MSRHLVRGCAATLISVFVAGCATAPAVPHDYSVTMSDIVDNVRCELQDAALRYSSFSTDDYGWTAGTNLQLRVVLIGTGGLDSGALTTSLSPGLFVLKAGATTSGTADRLVNFSFTEDLSQPQSIRCKGGPRRDPKLKLLRGNLGISQWLGAFGYTIKASDLNNTTVGGYTLEFTVEKTGSITPQFSLIPLGSSTVAGGILLSGVHRDVNTLTLVFTKNKPPLIKQVRGAKPRPNPENKNQNDNELRDQLQRQLTVQ